MSGPLINRSLCAKHVPVVVNAINKLEKQITSNGVKEFRFSVTFTGPALIDGAGDPQSDLDEDSYVMVLNDGAYTIQTLTINNGNWNYNNVEEVNIPTALNSDSIKKFITIAPQYFITADLNNSEVADELIEIAKSNDIISLTYTTEGSTDIYRLYPKVSYDRGMAFYTIERISQITNAPNHLNIFLNPGTDQNNQSSASIGVYTSYVNSCLTKSPTIPNAMLTGKTVNFTLRYI